MSRHIGRQLPTMKRPATRKTCALSTHSSRAFVKNILFSWLGVLFFFLCLVTGCPGPSEWDEQWQHIQSTLQKGHIQEAKKMLQNILPSLHDTDSTDERHGQVIYQLAEIAHLEGNLAQAESYYWKALPLIAQSLGPEHLRMADPLTEIARLYTQKNQPEVALPLIKRALTIREKTWGGSSRQLLPTLKQYHVLLMHNNDHEKALKILTRISHLEQSSS